MTQFFGASISISGKTSWVSGSVYGNFSPRLTSFTPTINRDYFQLWRPSQACTIDRLVFDFAGSAVGVSGHARVGLYSAAGNLLTDCAEIDGSLLVANSLTLVATTPVAVVPESEYFLCYNSDDNIGNYGSFASTVPSSENSLVTSDNGSTPKLQQFSLAYKARAYAALPASQTMSSGFTSAGVGTCMTFGVRIA